MKQPNIKKIEKDLIRAAHASGKVLMKYYGARFQVREKLGAGLVTNADIEAEQAAVKILRRAQPHFGFLTEEGHPKGSEKLDIPGPRTNGRWIIDPLDGTTNFVHGFPMFCVSIAAEWDGKMIAGVIWAPVLGDLYTATAGGGAWLNGKRMHVSRTRKLTDSLLTTGFTYRKDELLRAEMDAFETLSSVARAVRRPGSAALDLAYTARGVFDGFWERRLSPWDVAAGVLLVREAGGKVTTFTGQDFFIESPEILASNKKLHSPLINAVAPEFCDVGTRKKGRRK